ncbi:late competence development ComFB family protein [Spongiibacter taiwanensis]|uniref:late competence development ComFB family protein n=1 Tax=Spongiibacter taiwanensis TaxID=1748242 RepID=UPI0020359666|nr:late competence development ComFB family protein [Spongiibacter taiwanensis]USA42766.1 late competence development ComFB family protein [Spongiibacter taiwanensis]
MFSSDEVENFMEILVAEEFEAAQISQRYDHDYVQDLYCLTLNALPAHYVRHSIDVRINMDLEDRSALTGKIQAAMRHAHGILANDRRKMVREAI